tara:strand:- start:606 stop:734 length:129 start_codon:yes stop_codon:yes gene_type:complete
MKTNESKIEKLTFDMELQKELGNKSMTELLQSKIDKLNNLNK